MIKWEVLKQATQKVGYANPTSVTLKKCGYDSLIKPFDVDGSVGDF